ncbi:MAG: hypothetical protein ABMA64_20730 [Myxococcota bacterium]
MIGVWFAGAAAAGGWTEPRPYVLPVVNLSVIAVNGETSAQASVGAVGGARLKYRDPPGWLSHTRGSVVGSYGLNTGSYGADLRAGSFIGPDTKFLQYQVGPDLWFNGFGREDSVDYHLPWSPGIDLHNLLTLKLAKEFHLVGEVTPGFPFAGERLGGGIGPFPELTLAGMAVVRASFLHLTIGYSRQYRSFGSYDALILSGAL